MTKNERSYYYRRLNPPATVRSTTKGEETRAQILEAAVRQASETGFESLTIGTLAERTGLSKSGLFAHFGSKLELQMAALDEAARQFSEQVFLPALKAPRGVRRLRALFDGWITWPMTGTSNISTRGLDTSSRRSPSPRTCSSSPTTACRPARP